MSSVDYVILALVLVSVVFGLWRGLVREALSLAIWIGAFVAAYVGAEPLGRHIDGVVADKALNLIASFVLIFLSVHVAGFFLTRLLSGLVHSVGLGGVDRTMGGLFGLARGFVVVAALVLVVEQSGFRDSPLWADSKMVAWVGDALEWIDRRYPLKVLEGGLPAPVEKIIDGTRQGL